MNEPNTVFVPLLFAKPDYGMMKMAEVAIIPEGGGSLDESIRRPLERLDLKEKPLNKTVMSVLLPRYDRLDYFTATYWYPPRDVQQFVDGTENGDSHLLSIFLSFYALSADHFLGKDLFKSRLSGWAASGCPNKTGKLRGVSLIREKLGAVFLMNKHMEPKRCPPVEHLILAEEDREKLLSIESVVIPSMQAEEKSTAISLKKKPAENGDVNLQARIPGEDCPSQISVHFASDFNAALELVFGPDLLNKYRGTVQDQSSMRRFVWMSAAMALVLVIALSWFLLWRQQQKPYYPLLEVSADEISSMGDEHIGGGVAKHEGKLYVWGGYNVGGRSRALEIYNPATDTWSSGANMPSARNHMGDFELDGCIYSIGGEGPGSGTFTDDVYRYNPGSDSWTMMSNFPTNIWEPMSVVSCRKAYVIGGRHSYSRTYPHVYEYESLTDTWTQKADIPYDVFHAGTVCYDSKIYVFGGIHKPGESTSEYVKDLQVYDCAADSWTKYDDHMPCKLGSIIRAVLIGDCAYLFSSTVYNVDTSSWIDNDYIYRYDFKTDEYLKFRYISPLRNSYSNLPVEIDGYVYLTSFITEQTGERTNKAYRLFIGDPSLDYDALIDIDGCPHVINDRVDIGADEFGDNRLARYPLTGGSIYVDDNAPNDPGSDDPAIGDPLEDGSPEHPFDTIQEGIDAVSNRCFVIVLDGTYTGTGNRDLDFRGKAITVKSENGPDTCIIDCEGSKAEPHRGFNFHTGETELAVVSGFTIQNGNVTGAVRQTLGGGIRCENSSPTVINCVIRNNKAYMGGGVACRPPCSARIIGNIIESNIADDGGGVYIWGTPTLVNNLIVGNTATGADGWGVGGGVHITESIVPITNCTIVSNTASHKGGGLDCYWEASAVITNGIFWDNTAASEPQIGLTQNSSVTVAYSDIKGGWTGTGNIGKDPGFANPGRGDYHLQYGSPCIDAGTSEGTPAKDKEGTARYDDPSIQNTGDGAQTYYDIGAYEFVGETKDGSDHTKEGTTQRSSRLPIAY